MCKADDRRHPAKVKNIIVLCSEFTLAEASISASTKTSKIFLFNSTTDNYQSPYAREKDDVNCINQASKNEREIQRKNCKSF
jgi:hypothetical protein